MPGRRPLSLLFPLNSSHPTVVSVSASACQEGNIAMSASAPSSAPATTFNSISSRSFRRNVMMQSINAFFSRRKEPAHSRNPSDATTAVTESPSDDRPKDASAEEKDLEISPVPSAVSQTKDHEKAELSSSTSSPKEAEAMPDGKQDPFAGDVEGGVTYRTMRWWHAALGMVAETVSLGILGLAAALQTLGLVPGLVILLVVGSMATYAGYVIGQFKLAYPHVHSMGDAGEILFGSWGREIAGIGAVAFIIFIMGAHLVAGGHTLNVLTDHGSCTVIFVVVIGVISFVGTLPRTLKETTFLSLISFISVIAAIIIVMADLGIRRPGFEIVDGVKPNKYTLWGDSSAGFTKKLEAVTKIMFAFAGHVAFFSFISELRDPKDFPKALAFLQISDITMYATSAVVMYIFGGQRIESPALDSASPVMRKVAWGVALGTVIIAGVINGHIAVKYLYVRLFRNSKEDVMHQNSWKARGYWAAIGALFWFIAFILAEVIPIFDDIVSITGALFASWFTFGLPGMFWCYLNLGMVKTGRYTFRLVWKKQRNWKKLVLLGINIFFIMVGAFTCVAGLYATIASIAANAGSSRGKPFSCAVNRSYES